MFINLLVVASLLGSTNAFVSRNVARMSRTSSFQMSAEMDALTAKALSRMDVITAKEATKEVVQSETAVSAIKIVEPSRELASAPIAAAAAAGGGMNVGTMVVPGLLVAGLAFLASQKKAGTGDSIISSTPPAPPAKVYDITVQKALERAAAEPGRFPPIVALPPGPKPKRSVGDLNESDLRGKRVLVRCDLNVPLEGGKITDDTRIRGSIPTSQYLVKKGAKVLLTSHLGRPKGGYEAKFSLAPIAPRLSQLLGKKVELVPDCRGMAVAKTVQGMAEGDVVLLENSRFYAEEEKNGKKFALEMARNADIFVNDAFGTAHRAHASTEGVTSFLYPSVAGFLLQKELDYLQGAVDEPKRPFAAIVGGSKVHTLSSHHSPNILS